MTYANFAYELNPNFESHFLCTEIRSRINQALECLLRWVPYVLQVKKEEEKNRNERDNVITCREKDDYKCLWPRHIARSWIPNLNCKSLLFFLLRLRYPDRFLFTVKHNYHQPTWRLEGHVFLVTTMFSCRYYRCHSRGIRYSARLSIIILSLGLPLLRIPSGLPILISLFQTLSSHYFTTFLVIFLFTIFAVNGVFSIPKIINPKSYLKRFYFLYLFMSFPRSVSMD